MPYAELICLADARKRSERCVACFDPETASCVRLVNNAEHGELTYAQRKLGYGDTQKLDLIRTNIARKKPFPGQHENCLVESTPWQLLERPTNATKLNVLQRAVQKEDWIFGTIGDRIAASSFAAHPPAASLAVVRPLDVRWLFETTGSKRRMRALFRLGGCSYNLSLTDPTVEQLLHGSAKRTAFLLFHWTQRPRAAFLRQSRRTVQRWELLQISSRRAGNPKSLKANMSVASLCQMREN